MVHGVQGGGAAGDGAHVDGAGGEVRVMSDAGMHDLRVHLRASVEGHVLHPPHAGEAPRRA